MSDQLSVKKEDELATVKNMDKKGRSVIQEVRFILLHNETSRIQHMIRLRNPTINLTEDQKENRQSEHRFG